MGFFLCCCGPCQGAVSVTLKGCNSLGLSGETITIKQGGSTIATASTDGSGLATFSLVAGSYTVVYPSVLGFLPQASSSFTVNSSCDAVSITTTLAVDTDNYVCCFTGARPWPKALTYTDANTTKAATFYDGGTFRDWSLCYTTSRSGLYYTSFGTCVGPVTANIAVSVRLRCSGSGVSLAMTFWYQGCLIGGFSYCYYDYASSCTTDSNGQPISVGSIGSASVLIPASSWTITSGGSWSLTGSWPSTTTCINNLLPPATGSFTFAP